MLYEMGNLRRLSKTKATHRAHQTKIKAAKMRTKMRIASNPCR